MPQQINSDTLIKASVSNGLLISAISLALTIVFYVINPLLQYTNFIVPIFSIVIVIALLVILAIDVRKKVGGFWNFGQAFTSLIIMSVLIVFTGILLNFIIFKYIAPDMPQKVNDAVLDVTNQRLEKFGMEQSQIDAATKQFSDGEFSAKLQPTFVNELKNFAIALLVYAVIDLIIAAIIKRKPTMFDATALEDNYVEPTV